MRPMMINDEVLMGIVNHAIKITEDVLEEGPDYYKPLVFNFLADYFVKRVEIEDEEFAYIGTKEEG